MGNDFKEQVMDSNANPEVDAAGRQVKGRGGDSTESTGRRSGGTFDSLPMDPAGCPPDCPVAQSVEGWIVFAANIHEECNEEDMRDLFGEFGTLRNLHLNLDKATLVVKGYVIVEYVRYVDAARAVATMNGKVYRERPMQVDFAFLKGPVDRGDVHRRGGGTGLKIDAEHGERKRTGTNTDRD